MEYQINFEEITRSLKSDINKADKILRWTRYFVSKAKGYAIAIKWRKMCSIEAEKVCAEWNKMSLTLGAFNSKFKNTKFENFKIVNSLFISKFQNLIISENKYCGFFKKDYYLMAFILSEDHKYLNCLFDCYKDFESELKELIKIFTYLKQHNALEINELKELMKNIIRWMNCLRLNVREIKGALCCCCFSEKLYKSLITDLSAIFDYINKSFRNAVSGILVKASVPVANWAGVTEKFEAIAETCRTYDKTSSIMVGMLLKVLLMTYVFFKYNENVWNSHIFYEDQEKFEVREQSKKTIKEICKKMNIYVPGINRVQCTKIFGGL